MCRPPRSFRSFHAEYVRSMLRYSPASLMQYRDASRAIGPFRSTEYSLMNAFGR